MQTAASIAERLRSSLWFVPALFAAGAIALAFVLLTIDRELSVDGSSTFFMFGGSAEGARSVLSTIAQSMLTFTGLVFTITMLVLQLASSQLSPRVMRTFLRDRANQVVLGLFVATFVFTLVVLRDVRGETGGTAFVPALSIWVAFVLLLGSVAAFIYYIDHMAHAIRASTVIASIWEETRGTIDRRYSEEMDGSGSDAEHIEPPDGRPEPVPADGAGVVTKVDVDALLETATASNGCVWVVRRPGEFVADGAPIAHLWGDWDDDARAAVVAAVDIERDRTLEQDVAFGLRQLVDVATRALSPGTNDPTTAVQSLNRLHDLLRRLARQRLGPDVRRDEGGRLRVVIENPTWAELVSLALDEIRIAGRGQLQVHQRLGAVLRDLSAIAPEPRRPVLRTRLARLDDGLDAFGAPGDRETAAERGIS